MDNVDAMSLVTTSPRYQIAPANQQRNGYLNVENAFIAKTAVVSPILDFHWSLVYINYWDMTNSFYFVCSFFRLTSLLFFKFEFFKIERKQ